MREVVAGQSFREEGRRERGGRPTPSAGQTDVVDAGASTNAGRLAASGDSDEIARAALAARHADLRSYRAVRQWFCRWCRTQSWVNATDLCLPCQEDAWWAEDNRRICNWIHRSIGVP